jgi:hypothetical protein
MSVDELTLAVVGIDFPNADRSKSSRRMEALLCAPGEPVELRREPKNPHDPRAIAVFSQRGIQIGYLSAERAPWIGKRMLVGEEHQAIFQALQGKTAYIRIRFGGGTPALPVEPTEPADAESDAFYPDPEGPEWGA